MGAPIYSSCPDGMNYYNPHTHHRRSIRLKGYDYSRAGLYFITICCQDRICRFGSIEDHTMILNEYGEIAHNEWLLLSDRFPNFEQDVFQIMPNHMHAIISLNDPPAQNDGQPKIGHPVGAGFTPAPTVPDIVGAYKSLVANACLNIYKSKNEIMGKFWQRNYHEHIIRNEPSYLHISAYIIDNPAKWAEDKFHQ